MLTVAQGSGAGWRWRVSDTRPELLTGNELRKGVRHLLRAEGRLRADDRVSDTNASRCLAPSLSACLSAIRVGRSPACPGGRPGALPRWHGAKGREGMGGKPQVSLPKKEALPTELTGLLTGSCGTALQSREGIRLITERSRP
jgi:hypothetical protein